MLPTGLKSNTYVLAERAQFTAPLSVKRREFLARSALSALRILDNTDLLAESSMLTHDVLSPQSFSDEYVTCDDLTPIEKAARRLMMVLSNAKQGSHTIFTDEEVIALAFDADCDFTVVEDSNGAAFLSIKMSRVERRADGQIIVFEDGATRGVVLERETLNS
jgi:hypothetical protein